MYITTTFMKSPPLIGWTFCFFGGNFKTLNRATLLLTTRYYLIKITPMPHEIYGRWLFLRYAVL